MRGVIDRRILVNYRCAPDTLAPLLPALFRPKLVRGFGLAGICLIRLKNLRPGRAPAALGTSSANAAHRIAVEWDENGEIREGVFILRRDTGSFINRLAGGRLFPGFHHAAEFSFQEINERFEWRMRSNDGEAFASISARVAEEIPSRSLFRTIDEASSFFRDGTLGWSRSPRDGELEGLELRCQHWRMEPLLVEHAHSSFFADAGLFPPNTVEFDSAFVMRDVAHEWHSRGRIFAKLNTN